MPEATTSPAGRRCVGLILLATAVLLAGPALALANETAAGGGEEPSLFAGSVWNAIWALVIFILLLAVLGKFAWGPIAGQLEQREKKIAQAIADAQKGRDDAMTLLAEYKRKLEQAQSEADQLMHQAVAGAEQVKQRIVAEAETEAGKARDQAVQQIRQASNDALADIFGQTAEMATRVAGQIIGRELRPEDHQRLVEQTLSQLEQEQSRN